jgi:hypothetical protein
MVKPLVDRAAAIEIGDVRARTSGKQRCTGLLPPQTGSEPNVPSRCCPSLNRQGPLLSPMSQVTEWPHSSISLTRNRGKRYRSRH